MRATVTNCLYWLPDNWQKLHLNTQDAPNCADALLDYLEAFLSAPTPGACVLPASELVEESYGYQGWLIRWLIQCWDAQCQYAGKDTCFNDPVFIRMAERANAIGIQLSKMKPGENALPLFCSRNVRGRTREGCAATLYHLVPCRMKASQPALLLINADLLCVYAGCAHRQEAAALAAEGMKERPPWAAELLYAECCNPSHEPTQTTQEWLQSLDSCGLTPFLATRLREGIDTKQLYEGLICGRIDAAEFAAGLDQLRQMPVKQRDL